MLSAPLRFVRTSLHELGVGGITLLALFWCMVPFARTFFYLRDIVVGAHPMTGIKTPRLRLAFPFMFRS